MAQADTQHAPDNQRQARLAVSGCSNGILPDLINGSYEECGWHHEKIVFKKILGINEPDVFIYFWDGRDDPAFTGWWFGSVLGGGMAMAFARSCLQNPPESGWEVIHDGRPKVDPLFVSKVLPLELMRTQGATRGGQTLQNTGEEYVEWRRILPHDDIMDVPSDTGTFLRLCEKLGLYVNPTDKRIEGNKCTLSLRGTTYGGTLFFDGTKNGKITITQTDPQKKEALWWLLEPHTYQCEERPAKRRRSR